MRHEREFRPAGRPRRPGQNPPGKGRRRLRRRPGCGAANHRESVLRRGIRRGRRGHSVKAVRHPLLRRGDRQNRVSDGDCPGAAFGGLLSPPSPGTGQRQVLPRRPRRGSRADGAVRGNPAPPQRHSGRGILQGHSRPALPHGSLSHPAGGVLSRPDARPGKSLRHGGTTSHAGGRGVGFLRPGACPGNF